MAMFVTGSTTSTGSFGSVHTAGRVGIGTTAPEKLLHVEGSGPTIQVKETGGSTIQVVAGGTVGYLHNLAGNGLILNRYGGNVWCRCPDADIASVTI